MNNHVTAVPVSPDPEEEKFSVDIECYSQDYHTFPVFSDFDGDEVNVYCDQAEDIMFASSFCAFASLNGSSLESLIPERDEILHAKTTSTMFNVLLEKRKQRKEFISAIKDFPLDWAYKEYRKWETSKFMTKKEFRRYIRDNY